MKSLLSTMERRQHPQRGDIFYIKDNGGATGHEQSGNRPAIIISNRLNNKYSPTVEVVYLTTRKKRRLPTHVEIYSTGRTSTALCEQIHTVDRSRLSDYLCSVSPHTMEKVDQAILISLGLSPIYDTGKLIPFDGNASNSLCTPPQAI